MGYPHREVFPSVGLPCARSETDLSRAASDREDDPLFREHLCAGWEEERAVENALRDNLFYTVVSRYATQYLPRDQLFVITSEDLRGEREAAMRRVFAFIRIDNHLTLPRLDRRFDTTEEQRKARRVDGAPLRLPAYDFLASSIPEPIRRGKYYLITKGSGKRPTISKRLRRELEDRLRKEVARLHSYTDPGYRRLGIA
jgi:hypothetical protein